jgi:hypothetical protein
MRRKAKTTSFFGGEDLLGDLLFNCVASYIYRASLLNGVEGDTSYLSVPKTQIQTYW